MLAHTSIPKVLSEPDTGPTKVVPALEKSLSRRAPVKGSNLGNHWNYPNNPTIDHILHEVKEMQRGTMTVVSHRRDVFSAESYKMSGTERKRAFKHK